MRYYQPRLTSFSSNTARRGPAGLGNPTGPAFKAGSTMREKNGRDMIRYPWRGRSIRLHASDRPRSVFYLTCDFLEKHIRGERCKETAIYPM
jgi:hypothetical protein